MGRGRRHFCNTSPSSPTALCLRVHRTAASSPRSPRSPRFKDPAPPPLISLPHVKDLPCPPLPSLTPSSGGSDEYSPLDSRSSSPVKSLRKGASRRLKGSLPNLAALDKRDEDLLWGTDAERASSERRRPLEMRISMPNDGTSVDHMTVRVESSCSTYEPGMSPPEVADKKNDEEPQETIVAAPDSGRISKRPLLHQHTSSFSDARSRYGGKRPPAPIIVPPALNSHISPVRSIPADPVIAHSLRRASDSSLIAILPSTLGHCTGTRSSTPDEIIVSAIVRRASASTFATVTTSDDPEEAVIDRAVSIDATLLLKPRKAMVDGGASVPVSANDDTSEGATRSTRSSTSTFDMDRLSFVLPPAPVPAIPRVPSMEHIVVHQVDRDLPTPTQEQQVVSAPITQRAVNAPEPNVKTPSDASSTAATTPASSVPPSAGKVSTARSQPLGASQLAKVYLARSRRSASLTDGDAPASDDEASLRSASGLSEYLDSFATVDEPPPFPWGAIELDEVKKLLQPKELQTLVVETMNEYGAAGHAMVIEGFEELASEIEARVDELDSLQDRYANELRQRSVLLRRHVSVLRSFNGDEGARFADALLGAVHRVDSLSRRLLLVTDHVGRVERLRSMHQRAAASLALAKLNAAYLRTKSRARVAESRAAAAEAERDALLRRVAELEVTSCANSLAQTSRHAAPSAALVTPAETPLPLASFSFPAAPPRLPGPLDEDGDLTLRQRSLAAELADAEGETVDLSRATQRHSIVSSYTDAADDLAEPLAEDEVARPASLSPQRGSRLHDAPLLQVVASSSPASATDMTALASALRRQIELSSRVIGSAHARMQHHRRSTSEPGDSPFGFDDDDPFARRAPAVELVDAPSSWSAHSLAVEWRRQVTRSDASLSGLTLDSLDVGRLLSR